MRIPVSDRNEDLTRRGDYNYYHLIKSAKFRLFFFFFIMNQRFISRRSTFNFSRWFNKNRRNVKSDEMDPRNLPKITLARTHCADLTLFRLSSFSSLCCRYPRVPMRTAARGFRLRRSLNKCPRYIIRDEIY